MAFKDAQAFGYTITLPFKGKKYEIESPDYQTGMRITENAALAGYIDRQIKSGEEVPQDLMEKLLLSDDEEQDYYRKLLGAALDEMIADKCPLEFIKLAAATVGVWVLSDKASAEEYWNNGGRPNLKRPTDRKQKASRRT